MSKCAVKKSGNRKQNGQTVIKTASATRTQLTAKQKEEYNHRTQIALEEALSDVLTSWRSIPEVISTVDAAVRDLRRYALEHYYRENVECFVDDSGFDEEDYDGDEPITDDDIQNAVADYVGGLTDDEIDDALEAC